jgi:aryl-alcohol dehydrogenase-like predicted oxidoreductase
VHFERGLAAVEKLRRLFPDAPGLAGWAIRWTLMFPEVSTVIPGASREEQVQANLAAADLRPLTAGEMEGVRSIYETEIAPQVHHLW